MEGGKRGGGGGIRRQSPEIGYAQYLNPGTGEKKRIPDCLLRREIQTVRWNLRRSHQGGGKEGMEEGKKGD